MKNNAANFYSSLGVTRASLVFDIGANVGKKTVIFLQLGARVLAVEPQESCIKKLRLLQMQNENLCVVQKAVSDCVGEKDLFPCKRASTISTMNSAWKEGRFKGKYSWDDPVKVATTTLLNLIDGYGVPDFVKIDVEGYEEWVLRGLPTSQYKLPACLSFECAEENQEAMQKCLKIISFAYQDNVVFNLSFGEGYVMALPIWTNNSENIVNLCLSKKGTNFFGDVYVRKICP